MRKDQLYIKIIAWIAIASLACAGKTVVYAAEELENSSKQDRIEKRTIWSKDISDILKIESVDITEELFQDNEGKVLLDVPLICQYPSLETGCESVSATMVLQYYGEMIDEETFALEWLECDDTFYYKNGIFYGPNPYEVFVGNPIEFSGYGCFAPVIENAINLNSTICCAEVINGESLENLCEEYINRGKPLLVWVTMGMDIPWGSASWNISEWISFTWPAGEHCMVLVGFDETSYYFNDPMTGNVAEYGKDIVDTIYEMMGSQAVYISVRR